MNTSSSHPLTQSLGTRLFLCIVLWFASTYAAQAQQHLTEDLPRISPEAETLWNAGIAAESRRDFETAATKYRRVRELLPSFSPAARHLCVAERELGHEEQAVEQCRDAVKLDESAENLGALAFTLAQTAKERQDSASLWDAATLADRAAQLAPNAPQPQLLICTIAMARRDADDLTRCSDRLLQLAPDKGGTWYFVAMARASRGEFGTAKEAIRRAHALGLPSEETDRLLVAFENATPWYRRWGPLLLDAVAVWIAAAAALLLFGWLLSAGVARSVHHLPREQSGHAAGSAVFIRRAYKSVLWACCAYYYLSMPLVLLLVLGAGGGVIYAFLAAGEVPIKLVILIAASMVLTIWATLKSLFVRSVDRDPGTRIDLGQQPRLRSVLDEVAERIGTRAVDSVYMTPGTELAVTERRSSVLKQMMNVSSERCLILGAAVLDGMRILDFKSILGHEYGHFQNRDTAGGGFALAVRRSLFTMARNLAQGGVATWYNPAWLFVKGFFRLFFRISFGASRLQEVLCDRWATFAYGSDAFERGLRHVIERSIAFEAHANATLREVVERQRPLANLYAHAPVHGVEPVEIARRVEASINAKPSPYDSHPPPADRIALVRTLSVPGRYESADEGPAWGLFSNRDEIERLMTDLIRANVSARHGVEIRGAESEAPLESRATDSDKCQSDERRA